MGFVIIDSRSFKLLPEALEACRLYGIDAVVLSPCDLRFSRKLVGSFWSAEKSGLNLVLVRCQNNADSVCDSVYIYAGTGDLVITGDVGVAAYAIEEGAEAIDYRGNLFDPETIETDLKWRDHKRRLWAAGIFDNEDRQPPFTTSDAHQLAKSIQKFAGTAPVALKAHVKHARILIDADNIPVQRVLSVARLLGVPVHVFHDAAIHTDCKFLLTDPESEEESGGGFWVRRIPVPRGKNAVDRKIIEHCVPGDLILTCDTPLAFACLEKECTVMDLNGTIHQPEDLSYFRGAEDLQHSRSMHASLVKNTADERQRITKFLDHLYDALVIPPR